MIWNMRAFCASSASQALSERSIPAFHMSCFTSFLAGSRVLVFGDHSLVRCPEIREAMTSTIRKWESLPQATTCLFTPISHRIRHDLPSLAAQRYPNPHLVRLFRYKGPQLIQLQHRSLGISGVRLDERVAHVRQLLDFFSPSQSRYCARLQSCARAHANCCALHRRAKSLLGVPLDRHEAWDVLGFASCRLGNGPSVCHSGLSRCEQGLRFRSEGTAW